MSQILSIDQIGVEFRSIVSKLQGSDFLKHSLVLEKGKARSIISLKKDTFKGLPDKMITGLGDLTDLVPCFYFIVIFLDKLKPGCHLSQRWVSCSWAE